MILNVLVSLALALPVVDDPQFRSSVAAFDSMQPERALTGFAALDARAELTAEERGLVAVWLGLTFAELGRMAEAEASFDRALLLDEEAELPIVVSPKVAQLFARARGRAIARPEPVAETSTVVEVPVEETRAPVKPVPSAFPWAIVGGLTTVGLGAGAVGGGAFFGNLALRTRAEAVGQVDAAVARARVDQAESDAFNANLLFSAGAALVLGGATLSFLGLFVESEP